VRYPGLESDPSHPVARRQMRYFGSVVGFELADAATAQRFLADCSLLFEATSFGGVHSSAERRVRWGTDKVGEGFIRLSVGVEATADVVAAIAGALDRL
jgi:cystathionine gamma-lyase